MSAEEAFKRQSGRYGSFRELQTAGTLRLDVSVSDDGFERAGYRFTLALEDGFRVGAQPVSAAGRPFIGDDTGFIRPADE
jgi:hypothetical protein